MSTNLTLTDEIRFETPERYEKIIDIEWLQ